MDREYKVTNNVVLDDELLRSDGLNKEKLRIFWSSNGVYVMIRIKPLGL